MQPLLPLDADIPESLGLFYYHPKHYGIHNIEHLQALIERRRGGESGIAAITAYRGNAPGFARVLNPHQLALPERTGNNRVDSLGNSVARPGVGLLFIIPGVLETLRVNGPAQIVVDPDFLESFAVQGKTPRYVIVVRVEEAFLQCGKAFKRSELWDPTSWTHAAKLTSRGEMLRVHTKVENATAEEVDAMLETAYRERLY